MATTREIKTRIHSVEGTQQITKAMKLVATAKLQKIRQITEANKPYFRLVYDTVRDIVSRADDEGNVAIPGVSAPEGAENAPEAYLLLTSDRGLAGGFNINICRLLERTADKEKAVVFTLGHRGRDFFTRRGYRMAQDFEAKGDYPSYEEIGDIAETLMKAFLGGEIGGVSVVYTSFKNTLVQEPTVLKLLPLDKDVFAPDEAENAPKELPPVGPLMEYEPSKEEVMQAIVPQYLAGILWGAVIESQASEQGARMTAMDSATDNAEEIVDKLTLKYNRVRQAKITQEITEIINGSTAGE